MCNQGARNEIFAMQPAPIQVSYMGFPSTIGADYIHYLVTDEVKAHMLVYYNYILALPCFLSVLWLNLF